MPCFFLARLNRIIKYNLKKHSGLTVGALGFSNLVESFLTTLFVVVAGDNNVEEVDEMLSFLVLNLLEKISSLVFYICPNFDEFNN